MQAAPLGRSGTGAYISSLPPNPLSQVKLEIMPEAKSPLEMLGLLGVDDYQLPNSRITHREIHTRVGCIVSLWHEPEEPRGYVIAVGGANGGLLGAGGGIYHELGLRLTGEATGTGEDTPANEAALPGVGVIRVHYRKPGHPQECLLDVASIADLAARQGAKRFVFIGHSFGGAVAIQSGVTLAGFTAGVITLATQSGGCEVAQRLGDTPLLLVHGGQDKILGSVNSQMVAAMAGETAEVVTYPLAGHGLVECRQELLELLLKKTKTWLGTD